MVRLLLLGDLHLSTTGPAIPPACPDLESLKVDAIVSIGDIIDDNVDHADDPSAGETYEDRGRQFFARLNEVETPVVVVPGNHDPLACTTRITDGFENISVAHRRVIYGTELSSKSLEGVYFAGWGCERFDLTPAFRYDQYSSIVPDDITNEQATQVATESAATVEEVVGQFLSEEFDAIEAAAELGVEPDRREVCASQLHELAEEFDEIRDVLDQESETTLVLSHESPFNVAFDYHHSAQSVWQRLHRGSIPLKMAIAATGPDIVFSGHMHSEGRDVIETVSGFADLYNPGSPGIAVVEIDIDSGSLQVVH